MLVIFMRGVASEVRRYKVYAIRLSFIYRPSLPPCTVKMQCIILA